MVIFYNLNLKIYILVLDKCRFHQKNHNLVLVLEHLTDNRLLKFSNLKNYRKPLLSVKHLLDLNIKSQTNIHTNKFNLFLLVGSIMEIWYQGEKYFGNRLKIRLLLKRGC
jgi:hypothetical protein